MTPSILALDLGNSRLKAALVRPDSVLELFREDAPREAHALPDWWDRCAAPLLADGPPPERVALASVAGEARGAALAEHLARRLGVPVVRNPDCGLRLAVRRVETLGHDRRYAARGALELLRARGATVPGAVVVDAGTALTVDALRLEDDGAGTFLGGAIAPGPRLLAEALAAGGAQLPHFDPRPDVPALGRETVEALGAGVAVGFAGAARELVLGVAREGDLGACPVLLTGGARPFLRGVLGALEAAGDLGPVLEDELLVLRGLASAVRGAGDAPPATPRSGEGPRP